MSYDIYLTDPESGETLTAEMAHPIGGGTVSASPWNGSQQLWLNITYNYSKFFYAVLGEKGIRTIYGMSGEESIPVLEEAIQHLGDVELEFPTTMTNYWEATSGNAKRALMGLLAFAKARPEGKWTGD
jgi:hypothetical protein